MYGPILSVLLMGMVPVWGLEAGGGTDLPSITVAPPLVWEGSGAVLNLMRRLSASGVLIIDADSGQVLAGKAMDQPRPMASLTKLMTALLIVEHHALDERVTIPEDIDRVQGNVVHLPPHDQFTVGDLLSAALIPSANDAAVALARYHSGTVEAFVEAMNARAQSLGLTGTHYMNPTGLDAEGQQSTPHDLAWLTMYLMRYPEISKRMGIRGTQIQGLQSKKVIFMTHTHALLHAATPVIAGKTGTTDAAGQCLLSVMQYGGHRSIVVLLRSSDRYADMKVILDAFIGNASP